MTDTGQGPRNMARAEPQPTHPRPRRVRGRAQVPHRAFWVGVSGSAVRFRMNMRTSSTRTPRAATTTETGPREGDRRSMTRFHDDPGMSDRVCLGWVVGRLGTMTVLPAPLRMLLLGDHVKAEARCRCRGSPVARESKRLDWGRGIRREEQVARDRVQSLVKELLASAIGVRGCPPMTWSPSRRLGGRLERRTFSSDSSPEGAVSRARAQTEMGVQGLRDGETWRATDFGGPLRGVVGGNRRTPARSI